MNVLRLFALTALLLICRLSMAQPGEPVTDIDGNVYHTIKIGDQVWMLENLNVTRFRNGDTIKMPKTDAGWNMLGGSKVPLCCNPDNSEKKGRQYGKLYNWYAANDKRGLAPKGWHVPYPTDWDKLIRFLHGQDTAFFTSWDFEQSKDCWPSVPGIGGMLKENGSKNWAKTNVATNSSGFTALPAGTRDGMGPFRDDPGTVAAFWASYQLEYPWKYKKKVVQTDKTVLYTDSINWVTLYAGYYLLAADDGITKRNRPQWTGLSVRCIKDQ